ncbi:MAG: metallophosphoesterase, partial [Candidatus Omnitrophica bacterium]|nr:metallophosphoesterase [Candidatus Omnitrophota bacterium]
MKKIHIARILFVIFILLNVYSLLPAVSFYFKKPILPIRLNRDIARGLAGNKEPYFSFIVTSDTGSGLFPNNSATLKLVSRINREDRFHKTPIDFVVNVGDVTFRGKEAHYKDYAKIKEMIKFPVIDAIGNHDDDFDQGLGGMVLFKKYCGVTNFSFMDRNSYFIVLDDKDGDFNESQFAWL